MVCGVAQDPHLRLAPSLKGFIFVAGVLECTLLGGAIFGWPQLIHILKNEGIYADLCEGWNATLSENELERNRLNEELSYCQGFSDQTKEYSFSKTKAIMGCPAQDSQFALIFSLSVGVYGLPGVLVGYLLHHAGLRVSRISAGTMLAIGFLCLGIASKESPNWLFPAMILLALGGNQSRMGVMQFGDLYPKYRSTAITLLSGVYAVSASLFLTFQYAEWIGMPRSYMCFLLAAISTSTVCYTFVMPIHHIPIEPQFLNRSSQQYRKSSTCSFTNSLFSASAFLQHFWMITSMFALNAFQQNYNVWVTRISCNSDEESLYSSLFSYINLFTVFAAPLGGICTDCIIRRASRNAKNEIDFKVKEVQASFLPLLATSLSVTGLYLGLLFFHPTAIYMSLLCMVIARPSIMAVATSYVRFRFPVTHFNRLMGYFVTVMSAMMFLQYAHFIWIQHMYFIAHGTVVGMIVLSYLNPIHLLFSSYMRGVIIARDGLQDETQRFQPPDEALTMT